MLFQEINSEWGKKAKIVAETELMPIASEIDKNGVFDHRTLDILIKNRLIAPTIPKEYGGSGLTEYEFNEVMREISRASTSAASMITCQLMFAYGLLSKNGASGEQKKNLLPKIASGKIIGTPAITETHAGSDVAAIATTAVRKGDKYIINGKKTLISYLGVANFYLVFAKTDVTKGNKGITAFVVAADNSGLKCGEPFKKMGQKGLSTGEIYLNNCIVPESDRIGEEGKGFYVAMDLLNRTRLVMASQAIGIAACAYEAALQYAKKRMVFGKPLIRQQVISFKLVDMAIKLQMAQTAVNYTAAKIDSGSKESIFDISVSKVYSSEMAREVINDAVQIHGGIGYTDKYPVERLYRDQRVMELYGGASEIVRIVISRIIDDTSKVK